jgi:iron complex transport system substrate-binding protein
MLSTMSAAGCRCAVGIGALLTLLLVAATAQAFSVQDDEQQTLELAGPVQRIVSLAPGATAMLFAAGAGDRVVGTSQYSDEPPAAKRIERIGDSQSFDLERVLALRPDVVVVWSSGTSPAQIARLRRAGLPVYHHRLSRLDQIPASLLRLGVLTATDTQAQVAAAALAQRIADLRSRYAADAVKTVLIQIWDRPLYTVGRDEIMTDVIRTCGYRNAYEDLTLAAPAITIESALLRDPDVILALTPDKKSAAAWLQQWSAFKTMKAQRTGRMIAWSDQRLTGFGPSLVDAAEALCRELRMPLTGK